MSLLHIYNKKTRANKQTNKKHTNVLRVVEGWDVDVARLPSEKATKRLRAANERHVWAIQGP